jgi:hypothetical protein
MIRIMAIIIGAMYRIMPDISGYVRALILPLFVSSFRINPFGANQPRYTHVIMLATGSITFVATVSSKLKMFMPAICIHESELCDSEQIALSR